MGNHWLDKDKTITWDFQTSLEDTVRQKYKNEYVKIVEITDLVCRKKLIDSTKNMNCEKEV